MADTPDERSGSRWEPDASEHHTEQLGQPTSVIPGMQAEEAAAAPAPTPKRRIPRAAAAIAVVAAATIGGGLVGMALAGNQEQQVSDTVTTTESGVQQPDSDGFAGDGQGFSRDDDGDGFGHEPGGDGFGGHSGHGPGGH